LCLTTQFDVRTIAHLSDLHFGRTDPTILSPLVEFIRTLKPDLVAISGDLTQRARAAEFKAAREFLDSIPFPQIVVPGNHDVPLHNIASRFARPLDRYRRYISADLQPSYINSEIVAVGVNTARSWTWKNGRINRAQLEKLCAVFRAAPSDLTRIVVTHHPFDLPAGASGRVVGRSRFAIKTLAECKVDLLLAGHFHIADTGHTAKRYNIPGYSALIVSSGTSTSTRGRGQPNSFNIIRVDRPNITIERHIWRPAEGAFDLLSTERFYRSPDGWIRQ
jgi:3',5'-cyclic AMP phosphodiesterase CpdA